MTAYLKISASVAALGLALLAGCANHAAVKVEDRAVRGTRTEKPVMAEADGNVYVVQKGDTLSRIAAAQKLKVRDLVAWNGLADPNKVEVGDRLRLSPPPPGSVPAAEAGAVAEARPVSVGGPTESKPLSAGQAVPLPDKLKREPMGGKQPYSEKALARASGAEEGAKARPEQKMEPKPDVRPEAKPEAKPPVTAPASPSAIKPEVLAKTDWSWPVSGKILRNFDGNASKGIDIAGNLGDPVLAAGNGKVVYAGTGIRGYGKLVIIKHDAQFLSAYANNSQILVKEGQQVTRGQKIAKVGKLEEGEPMLHFEIRREGKPADPVKFLPARP